MANIHNNNPEIRSPFADKSWVHVLNIQKTREQGTPYILDGQHPMDFVANDLRIVALTQEEACTVTYSRDIFDGNFRFQFSRHDREQTKGDLYIPGDWLEVIFRPDGDIDQISMSILSPFGYVHAAGFIESFDAERREKGYLYNRQALVPSVKRLVFLESLVAGDEREWHSISTPTDGLYTKGSHSGAYRWIKYVPDVPSIPLKLFDRQVNADIPQVFELLGELGFVKEANAIRIIEQLTAASLAYILNRKHLPEMLS